MKTAQKSGCSPTLSTATNGDTRIQLHPRHRNQSPIHTLETNSTLVYVGVSPPSLHSRYNGRGDVYAIPHEWSGRKSDITRDAIVGITGSVMTDDDVPKAVLLILEKIKELGGNRKRGVTLARTIVLHECKAWWCEVDMDLPNYAETSAFESGRIEATNIMANKRMTNLKIGLAKLKLLGKLVHVNIATGRDIALLAECLLCDSDLPNRIRAIFVLLLSAGNKICKTGAVEDVDSLLAAMRQRANQRRDLEFSEFLPVGALQRQHIKAEKFRIQKIETLLNFAKVMQDLKQRVPVIRCCYVGKC